MKLTGWALAQYSHEICAQSFAVCCCYNAVNFILNPYKIRPIADPLGQGMGCDLWYVTLIYSLLQSMQCCMKYCVILDSVIMALDGIVFYSIVVLPSAPSESCICPNLYRLLLTRAVTLKDTGKIVQYQASTNQNQTSTIYIILGTLYELLHVYPN